MNCFPLCIYLAGAPVLLVGSGPQIREKQEKILPFGPDLRVLDSLEEKDLECQPALVIIGDLDRRSAEQYSGLCRQRGIPVNVVDTPELCTFFFPALIQRGDLTVSISTGGKSPGFSACLRKRLETQIPQRSGEILNWLNQLRSALKPKFSKNARGSILRTAAEQSLSRGRPLSNEELDEILQEDSV